MSSFEINYNMRAKGYDFAGRTDIHAMCTMAVQSAQKGEIDMSAEGYYFAGNYNFKEHGIGQCRYPGLPRAMVKMAIESVRQGKPVYIARKE